jgi:zinc protease
VTRLPSKILPSISAFLLCLFSIHTKADIVVPIIPTHEAILKNGLKVIVREDHRAPVVYSQLWYKIGSSYEPQGITGISHMLEHMMFKASKNYPEGTFSSIVSNAGGIFNAFTSNDYTAYVESLDKNQLEPIFKLEADRMQNLLLDPVAFSKERQVVMEERRMRTEDNPEMDLYEKLMAKAMINTPYGHPTIGWMTDIEGYTVEELKDWYQTWYAPNNATLVVVGDVSPEHVFALAKQYFEGIPTRTLGTLPSYTTPSSPATILEKRVTLTRSANVPTLILNYKVPSMRSVTPAGSEQDIYALDFISTLLTQGNSARLVKKLIRDQKIATHLDINYDPFSLYDTTWSLFATPAEGSGVEQSMNQLETVLIKEIEALKTDPITEQELTRVKTQVLAQKIYSMDNPSYQATQIGTLESIGMQWQDYDTYLDGLQKITAAQIQHAAQQYLRLDQLTVGLLNPQAIEKNHA